MSTSFAKGVHATKNFAAVADFELRKLYNAHLSEHVQEGVKQTKGLYREHVQPTIDVHVQPTIDAGMIWAEQNQVVDKISGGWNDTQTMLVSGYKLGVEIFMEKAPVLLATARGLVPAELGALASGGGGGNMLWEWW